MAITNMQVVTGYYDGLGTPAIETVVSGNLSAGWIPQGAPVLTDVYGQIAQSMVKSNSLSTTAYTVVTGATPMAPDATWDTLGNPTWIESGRYLQAYTKGDQVSAKVDLSNQVDGVLPIANGGTGVTSQSNLWFTVRPTGPTPLSSGPVADNDASTKGYVDTNITASVNALSSSVNDRFSMLSSPSGASMVGFGSGKTVADLRDFDVGNGDALIPVIQPYSGATVRTLHSKLAEQLTVGDWGAVSGVESSVAAQNMVDATGYLVVPPGFNLVAKNIDVSSAKGVYIFGKMTLPSGCSDFDRAIHGDSNNSGLHIYINEIDGNRAGQSGQIGTHLVYLTRCSRLVCHVAYAHDNYFPRTFTNIPSPDGMRQESSGCLFFYECHRSTFIADYIEHWGREGIFAYRSNYCTMALGHAQGLTTSVGDEYSGFQFSGDYNKLLYASVDTSQASGGSFDCRWSEAGTIVVSNNKFFGSLGMGHPNLPTVDCVIQNVISINSAGNGVQFVANSSGNRVLSATIISPTLSGISQSDGATGNSVDNFVIRNPGSSFTLTSNAPLILTNGNMVDNANNVARYNTQGTGTFVVRNVKSDATRNNALVFSNAIAGNSSATITDGNVNSYSSIIIYPSNANGANANLYISSISNGSFTVATASGAAAGSGAGFRYMVV